MTDVELDDRLSELAIGYGMIAQPVLERARAFGKTKNLTLAGALLALHLVPSDDLQRLLQELTGVRAVDPSLMTVYETFVERMNVLLPPEVVIRMLVFPVQTETNAIHVCLLNPTDGWSARALEALSGCRIVPVVAHEASVVAVLERHYARYADGPIAYVGPASRETAEAAYRRLIATPFDDYLKPAVGLINRSRDLIQRDPKGVENLAREPAIIRVVQQILARAVESGASDVHFEPTGEDLRVRVRVDGAMRTEWTLPASTATVLTARLKAMAEFPVDAATAPLDARIGYEVVWGRSIDLRFSLVPAVTGETVVLRVLDRTRERRGLVELGVDRRTRTEIETGADLPNGLILVTGPTGSGKSSTLYALLDRLNEDDTCVITAEDPVESRITGVTQVQCDYSSGVTFASALRSFLRQDPDVIMVGEIRDAETADTALKAALTGHLVLSTLHTNDAPGAVLRLLNMNLETFLIASALRLVVAQRLVRRLCRSCKSPLPADSDKLGRVLAAVRPEMVSLLRNGT